MGIWVGIHSIGFVAACAVGLGVALAISFALRNRGAAPVLMYHKIDAERRDRLTVSVAQLEQQLAWLAGHGYRTVTLREWSDRAAGRKGPNDRIVLLTFDDAYLTTLTLALPVLQRFGMTAVLFVPSAFIGRTNEWDGGDETLLDEEQLRQLSPTVELALHSHRHPNYKYLSAEAIRADLADNVAAMQATGLPYAPAFAFPYGGRPEDKAASRAMRDALRQAGITLAFRIGGRVNRIPLRNPYEVQRLDINGTDSLRSFARKVRWGKLP